MSGPFDPYHRWLGIPSEEQPADHYRLLGLVLWESDPEVIRDAAERQIAHVRRYGLGKHAELSQEILNELAAAKACLMDSAAKAKYDRQLRQKLEASKPAGPPRGAEAPQPPAIPPQPIAPAPAPATGASLPPVELAPVQVPPWKSPLALGGIAAAALVLIVAIGLLASFGGDKSAPPLILQPISPQTVDTGDELAVLAQVTDPKAWENKLQFGLGEDAPPGVVIEPQTGKITWQPDAPGSYAITAQAASTDADRQRAQTTFTVEVRRKKQTPRPPKLAEIRETAVDEGQPLRLTVAAAVAGMPNAELLYALGPGAPAGVQIDPRSGLFTWTPTEEQGPGTYPITVRVVVAGAEHLADQASFDLQVREVNQAPVITPVARQSVSPGSTSKFSLQASDPDRNRMEFNKIDGPAWAVIDRAVGNSAIIACTPSAEAAGNKFDLTVRVTDDGPGMLEAQTIVTIEVAALKDDGSGEPSTETPKDLNWSITFPSGKTLACSDLDIRQTVTSRGQALLKMCLKNSNSSLMVPKDISANGTYESITGLCSLKYNKLYGPALVFYDHKDPLTCLKTWASRPLPAPTPSQPFYPGRNSTYPRNPATYPKDPASRYSPNRTTPNSSRTGPYYVPNRTTPNSNRTSPNYGPNRTTPSSNQTGPNYGSTRTPGTGIRRTTPGMAATEEELLGYWDNVRTKRYVSAYENGKWHGLVATWDSQGQKDFWCGYYKNQRNGFCCLFKQNLLVMVQEYERGKLSATHLISANKIKKTFDDLEQATADAVAGPLAQQIEQKEQHLRKIEERAFQDGVKKGINLKKGKARLERLQRSLERLRQREQRNKSYFQNQRSRTSTR